MTNTKHLGAVCLIAFAAICPPAGQLIAQAQSGGSTNPIEMVVDSGTSKERWRTSQFGIVGPVGLRPNEETPITLIVSGGRAGYPVGIAPLDGGEIFTPASLSVNSDSTVDFSFRGGTRPGLYRILVTIASEQYELHFYGANSLDWNCPPPP